MKLIPATLRGQGLAGICIAAPAAAPSTTEPPAATVTVKRITRLAASLHGAVVTPHRWLHAAVTPHRWAATQGASPAGIDADPEEAALVGDRVQLFGTIGATREVFWLEIARGVGSIVLDRFDKVLGARTTVFRLLDAAGQEIAAQMLRPTTKAVELFPGLPSGSYVLDIHGVPRRQPFSLSIYELSLAANHIAAAAPSPPRS